MTLSVPLLFGAFNAPIITASLSFSFAFSAAVMLMLPARIAAQGVSRPSGLAFRIARRTATAGIATLSKERKGSGPASSSSTTTTTTTQGEEVDASAPISVLPLRKPKKNFRTQREKAGLGRANVGPSSPVRYWPALEIPEEATQFECSHEKLKGRPITIGWDKNFVYVQDKKKKDGRRVLKPVTIRDSCACPKCRDPDSGQKLYSTTEIPTDLEIAGVRATEEGLVLSWSHDIERLAADGHETLLSWRHVELSLKRTSMEDMPLPRKRSIMSLTGAVYWDRHVLARELRKFDYEEYMRDDSEAFWGVVIDIMRLGIVFLKNVPADEDAVVRIVNRMANLRETFYGRTFDVRAKPNAENVAYTSGYLGLHQDLAYLEPQPMIQVLHYMENSCAGGESLFSDGERVGRLLTPFLHRDKMAPLSKVFIPYHYDKNGYKYFSSRHVIEVNEGGYNTIHWSPPFQGQILSPTKDLRRWLQPARVFESLVNDENAVYQQKIEQGECVLFDNQRVLHGRAAFDPSGGGSRWLRGAYMSSEDFLSKAAHIPKAHADAIRGSGRWHPSIAQEQLAQSDWHKEVLERVRKIDPSCPDRPDQRFASSIWAFS